MSMLKESFCLSPVCFFSEKQLFSQVVYHSEDIKKKQFSMINHRLIEKLKHKHYPTSFYVLNTAIIIKTQQKYLYFVMILLSNYSKRNMCPYRQPNYKSIFKRRGCISIYFTIHRKNIFYLKANHYITLSFSIPRNHRFSFQQGYPRICIHYIETFKPQPLRRFYCGKHQSS